MVKKKFSIDLEEDYFWKAKEFGAKNKIKRGFTGVVEKALEELIPTLDSESIESEVGDPHVSKGSELK